MKNTNQINIPEAREAMDKFKMEADGQERVPHTNREIYKK